MAAHPTAQAERTATAMQSKTPEEEREEETKN